LRNHSHVGIAHSGLRRGAEPPFGNVFHGEIFNLTQAAALDVHQATGDAVIASTIGRDPNHCLQLPSVVQYLWTAGPPHYWQQ
jgi:hypothetical protein